MLGILDNRGAKLAKDAWQLSINSDMTSTCSKSRWMKPAQVFAQFTNGNEKGEGHSSPSKERSSTEHGHASREIQITETGEVCLAPDKARVSIFCTMTKDTVGDVKTSVNRRVDYIIQTLKTQHLKENAYKVHKTLKRTENGHYKLEVEIVVEFTDFTKCENVCNILVEKLDDTVKVSAPYFFITPGKLESLRCQACVCAVKNAQSKAMEVAQLFNQTVGLPLVIREESHEEYCGTSNGRNGSEPDTFQQKIEAASVTVSVRIFVIFEIKEKAQRKKRK